MRWRLAIALSLLALPMLAAATSDAATTATIYRAFHPNGASVVRTHPRAGYCGSGSETAARRDAWRCFSGNLVLDPCFSFNRHSSSVVCPSSPSGRTGIRVRLTSRLPVGFQNAPAPSTRAQPWALELTDGRRAVFASGASDSIEGMRLNYFFGRSVEEGLWGYPDRSSQPWTILVAPFGATALSARVAIRRAWM